MFIYRAALFVTVPIVALFLLFQRMRGKETWSGLKERFVRTQVSPPTGPVLWLHGASIGELTSARTLMDALLLENPDLSLIITANSYTARKMVRGWSEPRILATLAPLDCRGVTRRFLKNWRPVSLLSLENELWPNRFALCRRANIPVLVVGGRMSDRATKVWSTVSRFSGNPFGDISYIAPMDEASRSKFAVLGLDPQKIGPAINLKSTVTMTPAQPASLAAISQVFPYSKTVLAASTHEGEDQPVLEAFELARKQIPDLRLILTPRHPHRADAIAALIAARNLSFSRRSDTVGSFEQADVLLADTLGEMALWYASAFATFVGASLVQKGGHTPFEPAQFDTAIIHGPHIANHNDAFCALDNQGGAIKITDASSMAAAFVKLADDQVRQSILSAAKIALAPHRGDRHASRQILEKLSELIRN